MLQKLLKGIGYLFMGLVVAAAVAFIAGYQSDISLDTLKAKYGESPSEFIEVEGLQVHYRDEGTVEKDSIPLVLLHGTGASLHTWDKWVDMLKNDFRLIRLDLPAYGLTGPNAANQYPMDYYTLFLNRFLQKLDIQKCYLAGNSLGGALAWQFTLKYPERVDRLILVDAAGYPMKSKSAPIAFRIARVPVLKNILKYITPRFMAESSVKNVYADDSKVTPELVDRYWELTLREGNRAAFVARLNQNTTNDDRWKKIPNISIPVLIEWGKYDELIPTEIAQRFHRDLPNDTLIVYSKAGHVPMEEIPEQTAQDARVFLKKKK
ncbi:MAG: alpha/beta hydrolase [Spirosomataceae bacterium]